MFGAQNLRGCATISEAATDIIDREEDESEGGVTSGNRAPKRRQLTTTESTECLLLLNNDGVMVLVFSFSSRKWNEEKDEDRDDRNLRREGLSSFMISRLSFGAKKRLAAEFLSPYILIEEIDTRMETGLAVVQ